MTLLISAFDNPSATFAPIQALSGIGVVLGGAANPQGIQGVLIVEDGVMKAYCSDDMPLTSGGHRTELILLPDSYGAESWYTWEFFLPEEFWEDFTGIITIAQMHDSPDGSDVTPRQPNFMLQYNNRNLQATWPSATLPAEVSASRQVPGIHLEFDRWYQMCIHFKWTDSATGNGFREVFVDRLPICREWNVPTSYTDTLAPYFKLGMYFTNNFNPCGNKAIYVRNLKRFSGLESYTTVMGGPPSVPARIAEA